jgi:hypothetical protein
MAVFSRYREKTTDFAAAQAPRTVKTLLVQI